MRGVHEQTLAGLTALFDRPVIQNDLRSLYVELQVGVLLGTAWTRVGEDWKSFDFEHAKIGTRLEVKASAARQSWTKHDAVPSAGRFDTKPRKGYYRDGSEWVPHETPRRNCDVFVFVWHPDFDELTCDQRDATQWQFIVVLETHLRPNQASIGVDGAAKLGVTTSVEHLASVLDDLIAVDRKR